MTDTNKSTLIQPVGKAESLGSSVEVTQEVVLDVALKHFAELGFAEARLEAIAQESGMSKRMIHYHFGDKKGLYLSCLQLAVAKLRPSAAEMELDSGVPVEGVKKIVEVVFRHYIAYPEAVRLLVVENLMEYAHVIDRQPIADQSSVTLQLDKLLMLGQDAGAFRPGISAQDVFALITSLAIFRLTMHKTTVNLYGVDMTDRHNTAGMARMAVVAVVAFLTSNLKNSQEISYLSTIAANETVEETTDSTYDISPSMFD